MAKKKNKEEKSSFDYQEALTELEPKVFVRDGFIYHITQEGIQIKDEKDLQKKFEDYMKKD